MTHIAFFVSSMDGGGAERVAALLCNRWARMGHRVTLVATYSGGGECVYPLDEAVRLVHLADRAGGSSNLLRRFAAMRGILREAAPDAVVSFLTRVNVGVLLATRRLGIPVVVSERTYPPEWSPGALWNRLRRWTYPAAAAVVMQTRQGRDWLGRAVPRAKGYVIPNPCVYPIPDSGRAIEPETHVAPERYVLLSVGRLGEEKRFDRLIDAFAGLAERFPDWDLVILGEGDARGALEARIRKAGLEARVKLPGRAGNMSRWYRRSDLFAMTSRFEGFPNALLEAMAHGVPAVSVDCDTGPRDIIRHGVDGILVPREAEADDIGQALGRVMEEEVCRARLAGEAVAVRDRFSPERVGCLWDRLLGLDGE